MENIDSPITEYFDALNIQAQELPFCNFSVIKTMKTFP